MTTNEYAEYVKAFNAGIDGMDALSTGSRLRDCEECAIATYSGEVSYDNVTSFSWSACDVCKSALGGNRTVSHAWYKPLTGDPEDSLCHLSLCDDCVYYLEYGRLDDTTMAQLETA